MQNKSHFSFSHSASRIREKIHRIRYHAWAISFYLLLFQSTDISKYSKTNTCACICRQTICQDINTKICFGNLDKLRIPKMENTILSVSVGTLFAQQINYRKILTRLYRISVLRALFIFLFFSFLSHLLLFVYDILLRVAWLCTFD